MVDWLLFVTGQIETPVSPVEKQSPKNLKLVSCYSYAKWQLGDWCLLPSFARVAGKKSQEGLKGGLPERVEIVTSKEVELHPELKGDEVRYERAGLIDATKTSVDINWQDGTKQCLDSTSLVPIDLTGVDHDFLPNQFVIQMAAGDVSDTRIGMVQSADAKEKTATVRWFKDDQNFEFGKDETVSCYELKQYTDYSFRYGELVVRSKDQQNGDGEYEPSVGTITGMRQLDIEVTWTDGTVSIVGPQCIKLVGNFLDDETVGGSTESSRDSYITTTSSSEEDEEKQRLTEVLMETAKDINLEDEDDSKSSGRNGALAVLPRIVRFVAGIFAGKSEDSDSTQVLDVNDDDSSSFKGFHLRPDPPDDHFYLKNKTIFGKELSNKIVKEYTILNNNLPDGIYVCGYKSRMDLFRAAIIGAHGTPYQDGIFFFDIHIGSDYPNSPPSVLHHSRGEKLNPNLNANGTICLSLLGTWKGEGTESWTSSSTVLQLLLSIQALVLNAEPYFNEAGYDKLVGTTEGEKRSLEYNEFAFLANIKLMTLHMQQKPKGFEDVIRDHFRRRGLSIRKGV